MRFIFLLMCLIPLMTNAQTTIASGPMLGHQTDSTATIWLLLKGISHAAAPTGEKTEFQIPSSLELELMLNDLKSKGYTDIQHKVSERMIEDYKTLRILLKRTKAVTKTPKVMRNFSFLTGSCVFPYPYKVLKGKERDFIFKSMTGTASDFMLWLGDNTYYLDKEWESYNKMFLKNARMRTNKHINEFIQTRPQYAIWDDHDYGPNNSDSTYALKDTSLQVFRDFWANPSYGTKKVPGNFTHFTYEDVEFFLLDNRYYRLKKKTDEMFGKAQIEWLKKRLKKSKANFKMIVSGTQMLPTNVKGESWHDYKDERKDFLKFLEKEEISGVIFLSGDRHFTELNFDYRKNNYPLYEFTCSPLTSAGNAAGRMRNPMRSKRSLYMKQNFGRVNFAGEADERECTIEVFDKEGFLVWSHIIPLSDLQVKETDESEE